MTGISANNALSGLALPNLQLDEVGFEWAPRAHNRILSWDKGFEMLVSDHLKQK